MRNRALAPRLHPHRRVQFCEQDEVTDADVVVLVRAISDRVLRLLRRVGKWPATGEAADSDDDATDLMLELGAAAVQGRTALGGRAGALDARVGRGTRSEPIVKGPLCADMDGFSLHAAVRVEARDRDRLEHLCRYAGRPAIAESRLSLLPDGRVAYSLKKRWKDGTTSVVLEPQVLIERLVALVPRPRRHLVTYHGVLAPAAGIRPWVVPRVAAEEDDGCRHEAAAADDDKPVLGNDAADDDAVRRLLRHRGQQRCDLTGSRTRGIVGRRLPGGPGRCFNSLSPPALLSSRSSRRPRWRS